jgi:hypothetical protein
MTFCILLASYGRVGGRREEFPMLSGAVPTCNRGRKVAKTKFVIKHLNLETAGDLIVGTCNYSHSNPLFSHVPHSILVEKNA